MSTTSFSYQPLDISLQEIRLLTILPGDYSDTLECKVTHVSLSACPAYSALSYVWGDGLSDSQHPRRKSLLLNNAEVSATTNLLSALRQLRPSAGGQRVLVWVDALCINQADVAERSQQVSMMRDIYSSAERVIIWLGEADEDSDQAFDTLPLIAKESTSRQPEKNSNNDQSHDQSRLAALRKCSSFFFSLAARRTWFTRTWILQELAMARDDPLVVCGTKSAPWSTLMSVWEAIASEFFAETGLMPPDSGGTAPSTTDTNVFTRPKMKMDVLDELRRTARQQGGMSLRQLLMISRTSVSTDPRDRIYGLLGMMAKDELSSGKPVVIDYRRPISVVYADAMAHIFSRGQGPFFLSGVSLPGFSPSPAAPMPSTGLVLPSGQPPLPTWVPDFSRQSGDLASRPHGTIFYPPMDLGGASGVGADSHNGAVLEDNLTLRVEGMLVGRTTRVIPLGSTLDECIGILPDLEAIIEQTKRMPCSYEPASIAKLMDTWRRSQPLWRILISNKKWNSGYLPAPVAYEQQYSQLLDTGVQDRSTRHAILDSDKSEFERSLQACVDKKAMFTTDSGFVGTCLLDTMVGDVIAIIFGSPIPFVLRQRYPGSSSGTERPVYGLVGASYVGGIMSGEMVDELYCEDLMDSETFYIK